MSNKRLSSWCQSVLPANYRQIKKQTSKYQHFLQEQLPDAIADSVQVINVSADEIVIAVASASISNFLRLHHRELQQQINETFSGNQQLTFKTMPDSLLSVEQNLAVRKPQPVSSEAIDSITSNAQWIEDDGLKQALESLARQLKRDAAD